MVSEVLHEDASAIEHAQYELRRVDHLIYVSLKYTRTVDVIKNIVARLISTFDFVWEDFIKRLEQERKIFEIPQAPAAKCNLIRKNFSSDDMLMQVLDFYLLLRQFNNAEYSAFKEFRRNVTMQAVFQNGEEHDLDIDIITGYYQDAKKYISQIQKEYYLTKEE